MGDKTLTWSEIKKTPMRDLYMLQDVNDEIRELKEKALKEAEEGEPH